MDRRLFGLPSFNSTPSLPGRPLTCKIFCLTSGPSSPVYGADFFGGTTGLSENGGGSTTILITTQSGRPTRAPGTGRMQVKSAGETATVLYSPVLLVALERDRT